MPTTTNAIASSSLAEADSSEDSSSNVMQHMATELVKNPPLLQRVAEQDSEQLDMWPEQAAGGLSEVYG
jgi:hypothetical protein